MRRTPWAVRRGAACVLLAALLTLAGCARAGGGWLGAPLPTTSPGLWRPSPVAPAATQPSAPSAPGTAATQPPAPTAPPATAPTAAPVVPTVPPPSAPPAAPVAPTTAAPSAPPAAPAVPPAAGGFDLAALQQLLLDLVNRDRQAQGLAPVVRDATAERAGMAHAAELAPLCVLSHWNQAGYGPDHRYSLAGGLDSVMENAYQMQYGGGAGPRTSQDWVQVVTEAEANWMQSAGHRANILTPAHTGLGIGLAYDAAAGCIELVQEFTDHYVVMDATPAEVRLGGEVVVRGQLEPGASKLLINLAWEPLPQAKTPAELKQTGAYASPAQIYQALGPTVTAGGGFEQALKLDYQGQPGAYHIRLWVDTALGTVLAVDRVIFVR